MAFLADNGFPKGDADGDGQVQFSDFVIVSENFDQAGQYTDGDLDKDGVVQFGDSSILSENFGMAAGAAAITAPAPASSLAPSITSSDSLVFHRASDIDLFHAVLAAGSRDGKFDLNGDDSLTRGDVEYLVENILGARFGDAGLNRRGGLRRFRHVGGQLRAKAGLIVAGGF